MSDEQHDEPKVLHVKTTRKIVRMRKSTVGVGGTGEHVATVLSEMKPNKIIIGKAEAFGSSSAKAEGLLVAGGPIGEQGLAMARAQTDHVTTDELSPHIMVEGDTENKALEGIVAEMSPETRNAVALFFIALFLDVAAKVKADSEATSPPRRGDAILAFFASRKDRHHMIDDLHEEFEDQLKYMSVKAARAWYWKQVLASLWSLVPSKLKALFTSLTIAGVKELWHTYIARN